jgi:hypothetical protein
MADIDYVQINDKVECPICGSLLERFETKEGPGVMAWIDFKDVDRFQSRCCHCHNLIEFSLKNPVEDSLRKELTINDYEKRGKIY